MGLEVAFAESNGWDHHVNEGAATGQLAARLDDFARGLAALATDLGDRFDDTIILTMSEFGRAVAENGNRGTDHGHGNAMMVLGGAVRGGQIYGRWPGLARDQRFEGRDLAITTDFRDVFGEIVVRHLGIADPRAIFPGYEINPSRFAGFLAIGRREGPRRRSPNHDRALCILSSVFCLLPLRCVRHERAQRSRQAPGG